MAWQPSDERVLQLMNERPVNRERPVIRHAARPHPVREHGDNLVFYIEHHIAAVPPRDLRLIAKQRAQIIDGGIAALPEDCPPIAERLLVDVVLAALPRHSGREQHMRSVHGERVDELLGLRRG